MYRHLTSRSGYESIRRDGVVMPTFRLPGTSKMVSWWVDVDWLEAEELGMDHVPPYTVMAFHAEGIVPWPKYVKSRRIPQATVDLLQKPQTMPWHWLVAEHDVPILMDEYDAVTVEEER